MAGTTAFVAVLLGGCLVAAITVIVRAKVDIARIEAGRDETKSGRRG